MADDSSSKGGPSSNWSAEKNRVAQTAPKPAKPPFVLPRRNIAPDPNRSPTPVLDTSSDEEMGGIKPKQEVITLSPPKLLHSRMPLSTTTVKTESSPSAMPSTSTAPTPFRPLATSTPISRVVKVEGHPQTPAAPGARTYGVSGVVAVGRSAVQGTRKTAVGQKEFYDKYPWLRPSQPAAGAATRDEEEVGSQSSKTPSWQQSSLQKQKSAGNIPTASTSSVPIHRPPGPAVNFRELAKPYSVTRLGNFPRAPVERPGVSVTRPALSVMEFLKRQEAAEAAPRKSWDEMTLEERQEQRQRDMRKIEEEMRMDDDMRDRVNPRRAALTAKPTLEGSRLSEDVIRRFKETAARNAGKWMEDEERGERGPSGMSLTANPQRPIRLEPASTPRPRPVHNRPSFSDHFRDPFAPPPKANKEKKNRSFGMFSMRATPNAADNESRKKSPQKKGRDDNNDFNDDFGSDGSDYEGERTADKSSPSKSMSAKKDDEKLDGAALKAKKEMDQEARRQELLKPSMHKIFSEEMAALARDKEKFERELMEKMSKERAMMPALPSLSQLTTLRNKPDDLKVAMDRLVQNMKKIGSTEESDTHQGELTKHLNQMMDTMKKEVFLGTVRTEVYEAEDNMFEDAVSNYVRTSSMTRLSHEDYKRGMQAIRIDRADNERRRLADLKRNQRRRFVTSKVGKKAMKKLTEAQKLRRALPAPRTPPGSPPGGSPPVSTAGSRVPSPERRPVPMTPPGSPPTEYHEQKKLIAKKRMEVMLDEPFVDVPSEEDEELERRNWKLKEDMKKRQLQQVQKDYAFRKSEFELIEKQPKRQYTVPFTIGHHNLPEWMETGGQMDGKMLELLRMSKSVGSDRNVEDRQSQFRPSARSLRGRGRQQKQRAGPPLPPPFSKLAMGALRMDEEDSDDGMDYEMDDTREKSRRSEAFDEPPMTELEIEIRLKECESLFREFYRSLARDQLLDWEKERKINDAVKKASTILNSVERSLKVHKSVADAAPSLSPAGRRTGDASSTPSGEPPTLDSAKGDDGKGKQTEESKTNDQQIITQRLAALWKMTNGAPEHIRDLARRAMPTTCGEKAKAVLDLRMRIVNAEKLKGPFRYSSEVLRKANGRDYTEEEIEKFLEKRKLQNFDKKLEKMIEKESDLARFENNYDSAGDYSDLEGSIEQLDSDNDDPPMLSYAGSSRLQRSEQRKAEATRQAKNRAEQEEERREKRDTQRMLLGGVVVGLHTGESLESVRKVSGTQSNELEAGSKKKRTVLIRKELTLKERESLILAEFYSYWREKENDLKKKEEEEKRKKDGKDMMIKGAIADVEKGSGERMEGTEGTNEDSLSKSKKNSKKPIEMKPPAEMAPILKTAYYRWRPTRNQARMVRINTGNLVDAVELEEVEVPEMMEGEDCEDTRPFQMKALVKEDSKVMDRSGTVWTKTPSAAKTEHFQRLEEKQRILKKKGMGYKLTQQERKFLRTFPQPPKVTRRIGTTINNDKPSLSLSILEERRRRGRDVPEISDNEGPLRIPARNEGTGARKVLVTRLPDGGRRLRVINVDASTASVAADVRSVMSAMLNTICDGEEADALEEHDDYEITVPQRHAPSILRKMPTWNPSAASTSTALAPLKAASPQKKTIVVVKSPAVTKTVPAKDAAEDSDAVTPAPKKNLIVWKPVKLADAAEVSSKSKEIFWKPSSKTSASTLLTPSAPAKRPVLVPKLRDPVREVVDDMLKIVCADAFGVSSKPIINWVPVKATVAKNVMAREKKKGGEMVAVKKWDGDGPSSSMTDAAGATGSAIVMEGDPLEQFLRTFDPDDDMGEILEQEEESREDTSLELRSAGRQSSLKRRRKQEIEMHPDSDDEVTILEGKKEKMDEGDDSISHPMADCLTSIISESNWPGKKGFEEWKAKQGGKVVVVKPKSSLAGELDKVMKEGGKQEGEKLGWIDCLRLVEGKKAGGGMRIMKKKMARMTKKWTKADEATARTLDEMGKEVGGEKEEQKKVMPDEAIQKKYFTTAAGKRILLKPRRTIEKGKDADYVPDSPPPQLSHEEDEGANTARPSSLRPPSKRLQARAAAAAAAAANARPAGMPTLDKTEVYQVDDDDDDAPNLTVFDDDADDGSKPSRRVLEKREEMKRRAEYALGTPAKKYCIGETKFVSSKGNSKSPSKQLLESPEVVAASSSGLRSAAAKQMIAKTAALTRTPRAKANAFTPSARPANAQRERELKEAAERELRVKQQQWEMRKNEATITRQAEQIEMQKRLLGEMRKEMVKTFENAESTNKLIEQARRAMIGECHHFGEYRKLVDAREKLMNTLYEQAIDKMKATVAAEETRRRGFDNYKRKAIRREKALIKEVEHTKNMLVKINERQEASGLPKKAPSCPVPFTKAPVRSRNNRVQFVMEAIRRVVGDGVEKDDDLEKEQVKAIIERMKTKYGIPTNMTVEQDREFCSTHEVGYRKRIHMKKFLAKLGLDFFCTQRSFDKMRRELGEADGMEESVMIVKGEEKGEKRREGGRKKMIDPREISLGRSGAEEDDGSDVDIEEILIDEDYNIIEDRRGRVTDGGETSGAEREQANRRYNMARFAGTRMVTSDEEYVEESDPDQPGPSQTLRKMFVPQPKRFAPYTGRPAAAPTSSHYLHGPPILQQQPRLQPVQQRMQPGQQRMQQLQQSRGRGGARVRGGHAQ